MFAVLLLDYIIDYVSKADDSTFHIYVCLTEEKKNYILLCFSFLTIRLK